MPYTEQEVSHEKNSVMGHQGTRKKNPKATTAGVKKKARARSRARAFQTWQQIYFLFSRSTTAGHLSLVFSR